MHVDIVSSRMHVMALCHSTDAVKERLMRWSGDQKVDLEDKARVIAALGQFEAALKEFKTVVEKVR